MGNKLGWIIGGGIALIVAALVIKLVLFPEVTSPTRATTGVEKLKQQEPELPITTVLASPPSAEGDAGDDYDRAIQLYQSNLGKIRLASKHLDLKQNKSNLTTEDLKLLNDISGAIAAGAAKKQMHYYLRVGSSKKIQMPYYPIEAKQFQDLLNVQHMLAVHAMFASPPDYAKAAKLYEDLLVVGWHMMHERARLDLVTTGIGLQQGACEQLMKLYQAAGKSQEYDQANQYRQGLAKMGELYSDLNGTCWALQTQDNGAVGMHPGDLINLARNHADRCVRAEAIIGLGVIKFTASARGDRLMVAKLIRQKLAGPDPIEQAAAEAAQAMSRDDLRSLDTQLRKLHEDYETRTRSAE